MRYVRTLFGVACGYLVVGCGDSTAPIVASQLAFATQPPPTVLSAQPLGTVSIRLLTPTGEVATGAKYQVAIALSTADTAAHLSGTAIVETSTGVADFSDLSVSGAGIGVRLVAHATGVDSVMSDPFNVTPIATHLAFESQPSATTVSMQPLGNVSVKVLTSEGHVALGKTYSVALGVSTADTGVRLVGTTSVETTTGVANFTDLKIGRAGTNFKLVARVTGVDSAVSQAFSVTKGPASQIRFDLLGPISAAWEIPAVVRITDAGGNTIPDATNAVTMDSVRYGPLGSGVPPSDPFTPMTVAAVNGVAAFHGIFLHKAGTYTLYASAAGLSSAHSSNLSVVAGPITQLIFVVQPTDGTVNAPLPEFRVCRADVYGNCYGTTPTPTMYSATVSLGANPSGAALGGTLTASYFLTGPLVFTNVTIDKPGTGYTLVATLLGDLAGTLPPAVSAPFNIK